MSPDEAPPRPVPARPSPIGVGELERVMARGWPAVETDGLGDWVLRASSGFTGRGNSLLPYGDPTLPLPLAVDHATRWYAQRGLPLRVHVDLPRGLGGTPSLTEAVAAVPVGAELLSRGHVAHQPTLTMVGASADVPPPPDPPAAPPVTVDARLTTDWLQAYARQRDLVPGVTEQVLTGSAGQLFASAGDPRRPVAVARMSVEPGWAGVHAMWVDPEHRRTGVGSAVLGALALLAREHGMPGMVLQVEAGNVAARALYERLGFTVHHTYAYVDAPAQDR
ncbi:GNAT family N-acetyltransferase [Lapillicoccus jejuensis]|uniref:Acetyltransferase (GNAT) family protein n=1 Tax=Lapillicoccus jejuensis TaxID=402171 RepID=A0A542DWA9_9MICO|nr:GNAT family N-acetyltransferase [Lapillicoccus jejuensis]TQJ07380.1 acetyltransferase (GNAT) family protein [Lapillicoccus jejuensis]